MFSFSIFLKIFYKPTEHYIISINFFL